MNNKIHEKIISFSKNNKRGLIIVTTLLVLGVTYFFYNNSLIFTSDGNFIGTVPRTEIKQFQAVDSLEISPESTLTLNETTLAIPAKNRILKVDILNGKIKERISLKHEIFYLLDITSDNTVKYITVINNGYWYMENNEAKLLLQQFDSSTNFYVEGYNTTKDFKKGIDSVNYISETNILQFVSQRITTVFDLNRSEKLYENVHVAEGVSKDNFVNANRGRNISKNGLTTLASGSLYNSKNEWLEFIPRGFNQKYYPAFSYFAQNEDKIVYTRMSFGGGLYKTTLSDKQTTQLMTEEEITKLGLVGEYIASIDGDYFQEVKYKESKNYLYNEDGITQRSLIRDKILATPDKTYLISLGKDKSYHLVDLKNGKYLKTITISD